MDKFGIFKLLNSFYNFYQNNKDSFPKSTPQENSHGISPNNQSSPFSSSSATPVKTKEKPPSLPLQSSMLSTMNSHEDFVKRVMQKNNSKRQ